MFRFLHYFIFVIRRDLILYSFKHRAFFLKISKISFFLSFNRVVFDKSFILACLIYFQFFCGFLADFEKSNEIKSSRMRKKMLVGCSFFIQGLSIFNFIEFVFLFYTKKFNTFFWLLSADGKSLEFFLPTLCDFFSFQNSFKDSYFFRNLFLDNTRSLVKVKLNFVGGFSSAIINYFFSSLFLRNYL